MPDFAAIPDGKGGTYVPTVAECLNGAKTAGTQLAALSAAVTALTTMLAGQHPAVDTAAVVAAVQQAIAAATVHVQVDVAQKPAV
jgi:hypothetical protein